MMSMRAAHLQVAAFMLVWLTVPTTVAADPAPSPSDALATALGIAEQIRSELENLTHYPDLFNELVNATHSPQNGTYAATVAHICAIYTHASCGLCYTLSAHWVGGNIETPYVQPHPGWPIIVTFAYPGTEVPMRAPYIGNWYGSFSYGPGILIQC
ncbi:MAG: hypothetical protein LC623_02410 [Halobacteriales archaeon]|nr:hypothetical protein [Halobacteriales archaeon]